MLIEMMVEWLFVVVLATITKAWLLYLGMFFVLMVMYCPGGVAMLVMMQIPIIKAKRFSEIFPSYCLAAVASLTLLAALVFAVEMIDHLSLEAATGTHKAFFGMEVNVASAGPWLVVAGMVAVGGTLFVFAKRAVTRHWDAIIGDIIKSQTT